MAADDTDPSRYAFVVASNRLPVDRVVDEDGNEGWRHSPAAS